MDPKSLLQSLRREPFYVGQILRTRSLPGVAAQTCSMAELLQQVPRLKGGSLPRLFSLLGYDQPYACHLGGLLRAFPTPPGDDEDAIMVAPFSEVRELFWQFVGLAEALDESRRSIVLCPDPASAERSAERLNETIRLADIGYAIKAVPITAPGGFGAFEHELPMIAVLTPETLRSLVCEPGLGAPRDVLLSALGRVLLPGVEQWRAAPASHTAYFLRRLQLECALRGVFPALAATAAPAHRLESFLTRLWGKPIAGAAFLRNDSVESVPVTIVNYSGGLIRDPSDSKRWIRQDSFEVTSKLLDWLVGRFRSGDGDKLDLHYVVDRSGSMEGRLTAVKGAITRDLETRIKACMLREGKDRVLLTSFDTEAKHEFEQEMDVALPSAFDTALAGIPIGGGTDLPVALGAALESALESQSNRVHILLFSDGESPITPEQRTSLLSIARQARSNGRELRILYVVLDMEPPIETRNLILSLGGRMVRQSIDDLERSRGFDIEDEREGCVVMLSGEHGLPEDVVQAHLAGRRRLIFLRDISRLSVPAHNVVAVVASGRYPGIPAIHDQVRHLGRDDLPVFVLTPAEASSQLLMDDYPEAAGIARAALIHPENREVSTERLRDLVGEAPVSAALFRYLARGAPAFRGMVDQLAQVPRPDAPSPIHLEEVPRGFRLEQSEGEWIVQSLGAPSTSAPRSDAARLETFSAGQVRLEGLGILAHLDAAVTAITTHPGAIVDTGHHSAEAGPQVGDRIELRPRSFDRFTPILTSAMVEPREEDVWKGSSRTVERLGEISLGPARFRAHIAGVRCYERSNLDNSSTDERWANPREVDFETLAAIWRPAGADPEVLRGLANLLRLTCTVALAWHEDQLLLIPDSEAGGIWLVDLTPSGNGASESIAGDPGRLTALLSLGGRIALECPCESGFAGATAESATRAPEDSGCPRCTRAIGPVIEVDGVDRFQGSRKRDTLQWLSDSQRLPSSAPTQLAEKYEQGVMDPMRYMGPDQGSRRGIIRLVRRILDDRLGVTIEDARVASFTWLVPPPENVLGAYASPANVLSILPALREWLAMDVAAHEFFHNLQYEARGLFNHDALGHNGLPKPPFEGKLFIEGSAMWAESHVVDALAIRSSLELANLRQEQSEYAAGFQLFKYIEENCGGVCAVLDFLQTGDIAIATGGKLANLQNLYGEAGVAL